MTAHILLLKIVVLRDSYKHFHFKHFIMSIQSLLAQSFLVLNHFVVELTQFASMLFIL